MGLAKKEGKDMKKTLRIITIDRKITDETKKVIGRKTTTDETAKGHGVDTSWIGVR